MGVHKGFVTTQGLVLSELLRAEGYRIVRASTYINRALRIADVIWTVFRNRGRMDLLVLEVYSGLSFWMADCVTRLCRILRIPAVAVLHGGNLPVFAKKYPIWSRRVLERFCIRVAPSRFLADELEEHGLDIRVIPNAIRITDYPFRVRRTLRPRLIWMRSFHDIYNPKMALEVLEKLKRHYPDSSLVMAGADKGIENEIRHAAVEMGLSGSVAFPGFLNQAKKIALLDASDIYINTTRTDNMPVSVIEACAMGLPVVATRVGGMGKLLTDGSDGLLVSDNDPGEMADAILKLLSDPVLTESISVNARRLAEPCSWVNVHELWKHVFREVEANGEHDTDESLTASRTATSI
jgi:glycosyltransferase involved in cell wall biosynthesis